MEHTKGPWKVDVRVGCIAVYPESEDHNCLSGADKFAIHYKHGYTNSDGWYVRPDDIANARLIAAAPDLLEALQAAMDMLDGWPVILNGETYTKIRAAIAKAKGS